MSQNPELLLPVGNREMAMAAIHNGANAIYVGVPGFNARGRTVDFSLPDLQALIETCHLYGVKVNLALNILIFQDELSEVAELLTKIIDLKPDAFIIQDLGLVRLIRHIAPNQVIHASTQMTVTNHEAISLVEDLQIRRFVLGRENSLSEIKLIKENTNKELEVFVHGALCVSYSGQCFTSEAIGGRSANRGQCAQSCRFSYDLIVDGVKQPSHLDRDYLVSPQDLCGLSEIPELMDIGVNSFKVEGRLKTPEYVGQAARDYRRAIDQYRLGHRLDDQALAASKKNMAVTYSRGFFSGWLHGVNHQQLVEGSFSSHRGYYLGLIKEVRGEALIIEINQQTELRAGDGLLWVYQDEGKVVEAGGQIFQSRSLGANSWELRFSNQVLLPAKLVGAKLYLNSDRELKSELARITSDRQLMRKILVNYKVGLKIGEPISIALTDGQFSVEKKSSSLVQLAAKAPVTDDFIKDELASLGGTVFGIGNVQIERQSQEPIFISHKELKELRRNLTEELASLRRSNRVEVYETPLRPLASTQAWMASRRELLTKESSQAMKLNILLREKGQVEDLLEAIAKSDIDPVGLGTVILDFEFGRDFSQSIEKLKTQKISSGIATTRILKPKEYNNLKAIASLRPDLILIRNLGALGYLTEVSQFAGTLIGDFSLNVTNNLTVEYLLGKGLKSLCLSYDLNHKQVDDLLSAAPAAQLEVNVHQYMPSFHMEHCVFAAFLSKGSSFRDCGKPCERHQVELCDQFGHRHHIKADQECRNTMYNAVSISAANYLLGWKDKGLGAVRYEALYERGAQLISKIRSYQDLISGRKAPQNILESLGAIETYGLQDKAFSRDLAYRDRKKTSPTGKSKYSN